ncbi:MAG TPA: hypoxanthine phosphoribosyltransferase [Saprospiraceae bacterium]|nr:hypoxanthine phosphoribosyltransferase [Saprospiraceae bacterium]MCB9328999.1 hypoxanthine phosphoribosyltransferase [Lewinellaceae bacterium]HPK08802.1 hypoxanthine phosphoribosyltransferase [Saprospiraceae bacterium]HPQ20610.1 hypoxanthine phosphoribosyltransferase [Saprospiraceae bacterium]HRX29166.1 hypoxanthine phosphoribosyltransferase [Saprospiraceae bacterium]
MHTIIKDKLIEVEGLHFVNYLSHEKIQEKVRTLAEFISIDYKHKDLVCLVVLNGAFMFGSDLLRNLDIGCEIYFVNAKSYIGMESGDLKLQIPDDLLIESRDILLIEDIIDSGNTIFHLKNNLKKYHPHSIRLASLLSKPEMHKHEIEIDYLGFEIPNKFVIGYGLDYNHQGRNLKDIYQLREDISE